MVAVFKVGVNSFSSPSVLDATSVASSSVLKRSLMHEKPHLALSRQVVRAAICSEVDGSEMGLLVHVSSMKNC